MRIFASKRMSQYQLRGTPSMASSEQGWHHPSENNAVAQGRVNSKLIGDCGFGHTDEPRGKEVREPS